MYTIKEDILIILRGARNGFYYGGKVRFMHSLVMMALFSKGGWLASIKKLLKNTFQHGSKLAKYVALYKLTLALLRRISKGTRKWHFFIAGCLCGYYIFKNRTPIDQQLILYLLSRNLVGGCQNLQNKGILPQGRFFPILAMLCWGFVMFLFEDDPSSLQSSLKNSMDFLYNDSKVWSHWTDFVPIYVPKTISTFIDTKISN